MNGKHGRKEDISFHFASSDRDLMEKVTQIMKRRGHVSFSDSMGIEHFLIDGRKGAHDLARRVEKVSDVLKEKHTDDLEEMRPYFKGAIEFTMEITEIPTNLKGYRYIKYTLSNLIEDESLISPLSKTVYPYLCEMHKCNVSQIERDIRYAIRKSKFAHIKIGPKAFICTLLEYANTYCRQMYTVNIKEGDSQTAYLNENRTQYRTFGTCDDVLDGSRLDKLFLKNCKTYK